MRQIVFTDYKKAELLDMPVPAMGKDDVLFRTLYTAISPGTERANILGDVSMPGMRGVKIDNPFPRYLGYTETGIVEAVGENVTRFKVGDRVLGFWGLHREYQVLPEKQLVAIPDGVDMLDAAFVFIGTFPMAAVRKVRIEIGESAMVVGLGLLGQIALRILKAAGAVPVIAVDPDAKRRAFALEHGADYAFDPNEPDYEKRVRALTDGKGVAAMIEVTGIGAALNQSLRGMAKMGRVALLGCTRRPTEVDFYYDVHLPGVEMYGAHAFARPDVESYPGHWTNHDDCMAIMKLMAAGRLELHSLISEVHAPEACTEVYARLAEGKDFPVGVAFDWQR